jgi:hypothetical protein
MLDVVDVDRGADRAARTEGLYIAAGPWAWVTWQDEHQAGAHWQERGGKLWLMDGQQTVAYYEALCKQEQWAGIVESCAAEIEPWARVVRILAATSNLELRIERALGDTSIVAQAWAADPLDDDPFVNEAIVRLNGAATSAEAAQARGPALGNLITARLQGELRTAQMVALAAAPLAAPLSESWEIPRVGFHAAPQALIGHIGRHLLAGWAAARDKRDDLVTWALASGFSSTAIQETTGLARTTISRIAG